jgi:ubiquinone/menaquinone biosynthesis C-methylase UbiE
MYGFLKRSYRIVYRELALALFIVLQWSTFCLTCLAGAFATKVFFRENDVSETVSNRELLRSYHSLLMHEVENVRRGYYSPRLLFGLRVREYLARFYDFYLETREIRARKRANRWKDIPDLAEYKKRFPQYYLRTYHWLPGGYLTDKSAYLYDLSVEMQLHGGGHCLRRLVIGAIQKHHSANCGDVAVDILDVASGTGQLLLQLATTLPEAALEGVELSPQYARYSRELLRRYGHPDIPVHEANALHLPYADESVGCIVSVFLWHEIPHGMRRLIARECARVLAPGGTIVLLDGVQYETNPTMGHSLEQMVQKFHEPYYREYLQDSMADSLESAGLSIIETDQAFIAQLVVGRKPVV